MALSWLADREYNEKCVVISGAAVTAYALLEETVLRCRERSVRRKSDQFEKNLINDQ